MTTNQDPKAIQLTEGSLALFLAYAKDAGNWGGTPLVGGNVAQTATHNGNLTHLKKFGLLSTFRSDGWMWISFTDLGKAFAKENGINIIDD